MTANQTTTAKFQQAATRLMREIKQGEDSAEANGWISEKSVRDIILRKQHYFGHQGS